MSPVSADGLLKGSSESEMGEGALVSSWVYWEARALEFLFAGLERRLKEKSVEILSRVKVWVAGS